MIYKVITKNEFKKVINGLINDNETFGPRLVDKSDNGKSIYQFKQVDSFDDMDLDYTVTASSIKNFFLPFREELSSFKLSENDWEQEVEYRVNPRVIVGARACDINGLVILDKILSEDAFPSPYYIARRRNTFLIGMDHEPLEDCFCRSLGHDSVYRGFHLYCTDIGDRYYLALNSPTSFSFLKNVTVSEPTKGDNAKYKARRTHLKSKFKTSVQATNLHMLMDIEFKSPIWKKWGDKCLGCGTCSMVCPTCYCYGTEETLDVDLKTARKDRVQYSCNVINFAEVAGGHNFRPGREDRLKYRYYHHYRGFAVNANDPICVGCNRCGRACLAGINPKDVINDLRQVEEA